MRFPVVLLFALALPLAAQITPVPEQPSYYHDSGERIRSYVSRTWTDPNRLGWLLADSAMDQWGGIPHQWDRSGGSYGMRVASAWGSRMVHNTVQLGFESALHEDSRYRRLGEGRFEKRIVFAFSHSVLAWKPDGSVEPMFGRMAAGVVTAAIHGCPARSFKKGCRAEGNLLTEFAPDLKNFGRHTWNHLHFANSLRFVNRK